MPRPRSLLLPFAAVVVPLLGRPCRADNETTSVASEGNSTSSQSSSSSNSSSSSSSSSSYRRPNILMLFADDLGIGDLSCYGHPYANTSNICAGIGSTGTVFRNFHVTGATCSPSRTGCMTGRSPAWFPNYMADFGFQGAPTITQLLKEGGYRTAHIGKWHIGPDDEIKDGVYGIDHVEIIGGGGNGDNGRDYRVYEAAIDHLTQHVQTHGTGSDAPPLYMNVWGHISHSPVEPEQHFVDLFSDVVLDETDFGYHMREKIAEFGKNAELRMREYVAELWILDGHVGRLLDKLDELGIREDTLLVFSSDQGATTSYLGSSGIYKGGKFGFAEGGVRVPFIASWPGRIPAGRDNENTLMSCVDWAPTLCSIARIDCPTHLFEGEDMSDVWLGTAPPHGRPRSRPLFWKFSVPNSQKVISYDKWKMYDPRSGSMILYDLEADPEELVDVSSDRPRTVELLTGMLDAWDAGLPTEYCKADSGCKKALEFDPLEPPVEIAVPDELIPTTPAPAVSAALSAAPTGAPRDETRSPAATDGAEAATGDAPDGPTEEDPEPEPGDGEEEPPTSDAGGNLDAPNTGTTDADGTDSDSSGDSSEESPPPTATPGGDPSTGTATTARSSAAPMRRSEVAAAAPLALLVIGMASALLAEAGGGEEMTGRIRRCGARFERRRRGSHG